MLWPWVRDAERQPARPIYTLTCLEQQKAAMSTILCTLPRKRTVLEALQSHQVQIKRAIPLSWLSSGRQLFDFCSVQARHCFTGASLPQLHAFSVARFDPGILQ